jgi:hypothetical protein
MSSGNHIKKSDEDEHRRSEITKIKNEMEAAERIFYNELSSKYFLLNKFSIKQLRDMCNNLLGKGPDVEYYEDKVTRKMVELPQYKEDFIHFIIDEFRFSEIKQYVLEKRIDTVSFLRNKP